MIRWRIWDFLKAAGRLGGSSVIFALLLFAICLWEHYRQKNVPASWLAGTALLFFCYGCYLAWQRENERAVAASARLAKETPQLCLAITSALNVYDAEVDLHVFVLSILLGNAGAPTSVIQWKAVYEIGSSKEVMTGFNIRDTYTVRLPKDTKVFYQREMIQSIIAGHTVERKAYIPGRILLTVPGNRRSQIDTCSYRIKLSAIDFDGNEISAVFSPAATLSPTHSYFPHEAPSTKNDTQADGNGTRVLRGPESSGELRAGDGQPSSSTKATGEREAEAAKVAGDGLITGGNLGSSK